MSGKCSVCFGTKEISDQYGGTKRCPHCEIQNKFNILQKENERLRKHLKKAVDIGSDLSIQLEGVDANNPHIEKWDDFLKSIQDKTE